jgi:hypothetical protein
MQSLIFGRQARAIKLGGAHAPSRVVFDALVENLCLKSLDFPFGSVRMRSKLQDICRRNETGASHSTRVGAYAPHFSLSSDILIRPENALAHFRSGEAGFLAGQRPILCQPGPSAWVACRVGHSGLKARPNPEIGPKAAFWIGPSALETSVCGETQPVGLGWHDAGPLALQKCETIFRAPYATSGISGNRIRMSELDRRGRQAMIGGVDQANFIPHGFSLAIPKATGYLAHGKYYQMPPILAR